MEAARLKPHQSQGLHSAHPEPEHSLWTQLPLRLAGVLHCFLIMYVLSIALKLCEASLLTHLLGFAFPPLFPEAIRQDLGLTSTEIANSNLFALSATLFVRVGVGPLVHRYGPRLVMAGLLVPGAIPSGLAGWLTTYRESTVSLPQPLGIKPLF